MSSMNMAENSPPCAPKTSNLTSRAPLERFDVLAAHAAPRDLRRVGSDTTAFPKATFDFQTASAADCRLPPDLTWEAGASSLMLLSSEEDTTASVLDSSHVTASWKSSSSAFSSASKRPEDIYGANCHAASAPRGSSSVEQSAREVAQALRHSPRLKSISLKLRSRHKSSGTLRPSLHHGMSAGRDRVPNALCVRAHNSTPPYDRLDSASTRHL